MKPCHCETGHQFFKHQVPDDGVCPIDGTDITCPATVRSCEQDHRFGDEEVPASGTCPIDGSPIIEHAAPTKAPPFAAAASKVKRTTKRGK